MSSSDWTPLPALADLLVYPSQATAPHVAYCREFLAEREPALFDLVAESLDLFERSSLHGLEELYTQTFDLSPVCTLEVGWHLYGEQYERGRFLVSTRELLEEVGLSEGGELPDYLPSLLRALPELDEASAVELTAACLLPAATKMCAALEGKGNPYGSILQAVRDGLTARVPESEMLDEGERYRPHIRPPKRGMAPADLVQLGNGEGGRHG